MIAHDYLGSNPHAGDHIVAAPRAIDAIGQALKGAYRASALPADLHALLTRLDCIEAR